MMKSLLFFAAASVSAFAVAQTQSAFVDADAYGASGVKKVAGDVFCETQDVKITFAFEETYKSQSLTADGGVVNQVEIDGVAYDLGTGIQGGNNVKEAQFNQLPTKGAALKIDAGADGYLYVFSKVSNNKTFYVADAATESMVKYAYSVSLFNVANGDNYAFTLPSIEGNPGVFYEGILNEDGKVGTETNADADYTEDGSGKKFATSQTCYEKANPKDAKAWSGNASGVIAFPVKAGKSYLLYGGGTKLIHSGFVFIPGATALATVTAVKVENPENPENPETAIKEVKISDLDADAPVFNIQGQRVGKSFKGVCIQGGKKYVVK